MGIRFNIVYLITFLRNPSSYRAQIKNLVTYNTYYQCSKTQSRLLHRRYVALDRSTFFLNSLIREKLLHGMVSLLTLCDRLINLHQTYIQSYTLSHKTYPTIIHINALIKGVGLIILYVISLGYTGILSIQTEFYFGICCAT